MYTTNPNEALERAFELAPLPFEPDALEPILSRRALELHHGAHHRMYVDALNRLVRGTDLEKLPLDELVRRTAGDEAHRDVFDNAAQAWNHHFQWRSLAPGGQRPEGRLRALLERDLGGYESFIERLVREATAHFGSGWAWLALDNDRLRVLATADADTPLAHGATPLLAIDLWEHAYYLDYRNRREDYVRAVADALLNWRFAARSLG